MKTDAKFYTPIQERLVLIADANSEYIKMKGCGWRLRLKFMDQFMKKIKYASSEWSGEAAHLRSLARAFADST